MSLLRLTHFIKKYDSREILNIPELVIPEGLHLLLGPNGSGKSTFMKILSGLIPFQGNAIFSDEIHLGKDHQKQRLYINYSESEPLFPPYLNGSYLVEMFTKLKKTDSEVLEHLKMELGILDFLDQKISSYSSGMKKKLALLIAFVGQPKLILLDEPFNALDIHAKRGTERLIREWTQKGCSFIISTHVHTSLPDLPFTTVMQIEKQTITFTNQES
ncbi:MAG: ATP-binding cassette domain-containing protein [Bacteroidia bacterium]|nr:ATP-binding cassette domain-containing protein [Bacteroidia bacterium]